MIKITNQMREAGYRALGLGAIDLAIPEFKQIVHQHILAAGEAGEPDWILCRSRAVARERWVEDERTAMADAEADDEATPAEVIERSLQVANLSVDEIVGSYLTRAGDEYLPIELAPLDRAPVLYIQRTGVYLWSPNTSAPPTLMAWLSWPAYPPGW